MEEIQRQLREVAFADKMAVRRMFYVDPYAKHPEWKPEGVRTIARWFKQAHVFNHSYPSEQNAEMKGMQRMLDLILADLLDDPVDFMMAMKREEERRREEMPAI